MWFNFMTIEKAQSARRERMRPAKKAALLQLQQGKKFLIKMQILSEFIKQIDCFGFEQQPETNE